MALTVVFGVAAYVGSLFDGPVGNYLAVAAMLAFIVTIVVGMSEAMTAWRSSRSRTTPSY